MGTMTIDGRKVEFTDEKNVLTVIRNAGINIPTLCYHSEVSTFGACRLCTVEDDRGKTFASCSEQPRDGMVIYTNSGRIKKYRKLIVELLLAAHCRDCTTCVKSGECILQELAHRLGVRDIRFENTREQHEIDDSSPSIIRDPNKCILCGDCVRACEELQGIGALGFAFRGTEPWSWPAFNKKIAETQCVNCVSAVFTVRQVRSPSVHIWMKYGMHWLIRILVLLHRLHRQFVLQLVIITDLQRQKCYG